MKRGLIRWNLFAVLFIVVLGVVYRFTLFDEHVKRSFERRWSQLNGSEVNIALLKTDLLAATIDMSDIEISNTASLEWNRLEFGRLHLTLAWMALLHGKIQIDEALLSDLKVNTKRKFVATTFPPFAKPVEMAKSRPNNPLQGVAEFFQRSENPVNSQEGTPSSQITRNMDNVVSTFLKGWQERIAAAPSAASLSQQLSVKGAGKEEWERNIRGGLKSVQGLRDQLKVQSGQLLTKIQGVEDLADQDMAVFRQKLQAPDLDIRELAHAIGVGEARRWVRYVEAYYSNWQAFFEGRTYQRPEDYGREQGVDFRFPVAGGRPSFWLKSMQISSESGEEGAKGLISGSIADLSSDPALIDKPLHININGDFENLKGLQIEALVDHRKEAADDLLRLNVASYPVQNRNISSGPLLTLGILQADSSVNFEFSRKDSAVQAHLRSAFGKVVYRVDSSSQKVKTLFEEAVAPVQAVQIDGDGKGVYPAMDWTFSSNLADKLKEHLQQAASKESSEIQSRVKDEVLARLAEDKKRLSGNFLEGLRPLQETLQTVEDGLKKLAEDVKTGRVAAAKAGNPI